MSKMPQLAGRISSERYMLWGLILKEFVAAIIAFNIQTVEQPLFPSIVTKQLVPACSPEF